jgi:taurine dioxygenase
MADITVRRLGGAIGAEVQGVDLREPMSNEVFEVVSAALWRHHVLFVRNQELSPEQHVAVAERFGVVEPVVRSDVLAFVEDTAESPPMTDEWHTDATHTAQPPAIAFLYAMIIPEYGGDTMWANLHSVYDSLSPKLQEICEGLDVVHTAAKESYLAMVAHRFGKEEAARRVETMRAVHPLVRTHPVTGRQALFLSERFAESIVGLQREESDVLLGYLTHLVENQNYQVRWRWQTGDLAIWDEACTNHRALSDHFPQHRLMRRCSVAGEKPFFRPSRTAVGTAVTA